MKEYITEFVIMLLALYNVCTKLLNIFFSPFHRFNCQIQLSDSVVRLSCHCQNQLSDSAFRLFRQIQLSDLVVFCQFSAFSWQLNKLHLKYIIYVCLAHAEESTPKARYTDEENLLRQAEEWTEDDGEARSTESIGRTSLFHKNSSFYLYLYHLQCSNALI